MRGAPKALGSQYRNGRRLVLDIDDETFDQIRRHADKEDMSISATVRELVEFGLETVNERAGP